MNWLVRSLFSSIGKKQVMAITGLVFCLFLATHLAGNLTVYGGEAMFNSYSERLHSFGLLVNIAEIGLLVFAVFHVFLAVVLYLENLQARPIRYAVKRNAGGRTLSSMLMPYTGLYLLIFVIIHLFTFHFVEREGGVFELVEGAFSNPDYVIFYIFSMVVGALHVKHGLWSAFQSIGANHPKYTPFIEKLSLIFSLAIGAGFGSIPFFFFIE